MASKIDNLTEALNEIKIILTKQESTLRENTAHLDELKESVKEHIKRSDATDKLVSILQSDLLNKKDSDKLILAVLASAGAVLLALKELGIFNKLF
jgi:transcriptional regulator CtsR